MSVTSEITRISNAKQDIKNSLLTSYNIDVSNNTIDKYANIINPTIVLNDITPYNLQEASWNPAAKVLTLNANSTAFAYLNAVPDASDFSFSFRALGTVGNGTFRFNLSTYNTYKAFNDASQLFRMLFNPLIPCFTLTRGSTPTVSTQITSVNNYFKIVFINGNVIIYEGSTPDDFTVICRSKLLVSGSLFLVVVNASAYAQQFDYLKFN